MWKKAMPSSEDLISRSNVSSKNDSHLNALTRLKKAVALIIKISHNRNAKSTSPYPYSIGRSASNPA
jgi:hypothetical protein